MAPVELAACSGKGPLFGWQIVPFAGSVPFAKKARVFCAMHVDAAAKEVCCVATIRRLDSRPLAEGTHPGRIEYQEGGGVTECLVDNFAARDRGSRVILHE